MNIPLTTLPLLVSVSISMCVCLFFFSLPLTNTHVLFQELSINLHV